MAGTDGHSYEVDGKLRERAKKVIPNGMYGHQSVARLPDGYPQFFSHGEGSHVWDADGPEDAADQFFYRYNDLESVRAAADEAGEGLAAIIVSPFRHDAGHVQEMPTQEFVQGCRDICDATGAVLILDDVRAGFRLDLRG